MVNVTYVLMVFWEPRPPTGNLCSPHNTSCIYHKGALSWVEGEKSSSLNLRPWVNTCGNGENLIHCPVYHTRKAMLKVIGIDHDTVCVVVVGTAIRDCSTNQDSADRISGQFLFYHDHNFTERKGNLHFSTSCTAVRPHRHLRNNAWQRDS